MGQDPYGRLKGCNLHGAAIEEGYRFHRQSVFRKWPAIGLDDEAACRAMLRSCTRMSIEDGYRFHPKRYLASAFHRMMMRVRRRAYSWIFPIVRRHLLRAVLHQRCDG